MANADDLCGALPAHFENLLLLTVLFGLHFQGWAILTPAGVKITLLEDVMPTAKDEILHADAIVLIYLSRPHAKT